MTPKSYIRSIREELREHKSLSSIARKHNVSRQAIHQFINRNKALYSLWQLAKQEQKSITIKHNKERKDAYAKKILERRIEAVQSNYGISYEEYLTLSEKSRKLLHRRKKIFEGKKRNAAYYNKKFTLKFEDIYWPKYCPILKTKLNYFSSIAASNSPSFDQIKAGLGYTSDNVQIISHRANYIKSNASLEELSQLIKYLKDNKANKFWYSQGAFKRRLEKRLQGVDSLCS